MASTTYLNLMRQILAVYSKNLIKLNTLFQKKKTVYNYLTKWTNWKLGLVNNFHASPIKLDAIVSPFTLTSYPFTFYILVIPTSIVLELAANLKHHLHAGILLRHQMDAIQTLSYRKLVLLMLFLMILNNVFLIDIYYNS